MNLSGSTALFTGGATGIGLALAEILVREGNRVLVCARREDKLRAAREKLPAIEARACDVSDPAARRGLADWAAERGANVLVNNAGVQRMLDFRKAPADLEAGEDEFRINFEAPVRLTALLLPGLLAKKEAAVVNVCSGLAFVPIAVMPVYCAAKAAVHSFSVSLRQQLRSRPVKVFEAIPPVVDTELDRGARKRRGQADRGIPAAQAAAEIVEGLRRDEFEIAVGGAKNLIQAARLNFDQLFQGMNRS